MKLTRKEVGKLQMIHVALWEAIRTASSKKLAKRLDKAWKKLPAANRSGK